MIILQVLFPTGIGGVERIASQLISNECGRISYVAIDVQYIKAFSAHFNIDDRYIIPIDCSSFVRGVISVKKCIDTIKPDVIHTHARKEMVCVSLCNKKIKHIRTQHMEENPRIPVSFFERKLLNKRIDRWVATSKLLASTYLYKKDYIDEDKVEIIYNGAECGSGRLSYVPRGHYCIISRLSKQKGIDLLIRAVSEFDDKIQKNIKIDIWGEGEEQESLIDLVNELGLENIFVFKGSTKTPSEVVINYDALLMPSRHEGLPLTMLECMSTGTPVATHKVGCINEFINNMKNGWIIDDSFSWENFFSMSLSEKEYKSICLGAKETYDNLFSLDKMKNQYFNLYNSIII